MRLSSLAPPAPPAFLISFDFDDTLYDWTDSERLPRAFFDVIREWREHFGILWGINTGRSYDFLKEGYEREVKAPFAPDFVISMERHIHLADQGGHLRPYAPWNDQCDHDHQELFRRHQFDFDRLFAELESRFDSVGWWRQPGDDFSIEVEQPPDLEPIAIHVESFLAARPDLSVQRADPYLRFCHAQYNKGTALCHVAELLGIPPGNLLAIGDGHNDIDTLLANPDALCAAPANAVEPLKSLVRGRGGYVSALPCCQGTLDILERFKPRLADPGPCSRQLPK